MISDENIVWNTEYEACLCPNSFECDDEILKDVTCKKVTGKTFYFQLNGVTELFIEPQRLEIMKKKDLFK